MSKWTSAVAAKAVTHYVVKYMSKSDLELQESTSLLYSAYKDSLRHASIRIVCMLLNPIDYLGSIRRTLRRNGKYHNPDPAQKCLPTW